MAVTALDRAMMVSSPDPDEVAFVVATRFSLDRGHGAVTGARLVATAHGTHLPSLNGRPVGPEVFSPGWTSYQWRLQCQTWQVATLLTAEGSNELSFEVGNGWWRGDLGFAERGADYGDDIAVMAALEITFADGHHQQVVTTQDWQVTRSRTTFNTIYDGQHLDLRITPGQPRSARAVSVNRETLVEQSDPPVVRHESLVPQRIWTSPSGRTLVDFGQNLVGWPRFTSPDDPGRVITLRHAEVLEHGELGTRPLRSAKQTDVITCSDQPTVVEPTFTFHGFRYLEIDGWPEVTAEDLEAVVVHSDLRRIGHFSCSDERVNQLERNVVWGLRGNFLEVPTDCPQRDERMGWTGDLAVFAPTAAFLYDVSQMLHGWLLDLRAELDSRGTVPSIVPDLFPLMADRWDSDTGATCVWGDAAVWVAQALWHQYGDLEQLGAHFQAMAKHTDSVEAALSPNGLWDTGFQYADWLDPDAPADNPGASKADKGVVATACAHRTARFVAESAALLGLDEDHQHYGALADRVRAAFHEHYVERSADGLRIRSDCATVYALAIQFGLLDQDDLQAAGDRLAEIVRETGHRISSGFAGTAYVTWALTATGHVEDAYGLLLQTECPSWLYPVTMGATTIWERWDSMLPDGSINPGTMTSFNHYAFGAVADWLHQVVGGIRPSRPGYDEIEIRPVPGPGLTWAESSLETRHGLATCRWEINDNTLTVRVVTPPVPTTVVLPNGDTHQLHGGEHIFTQPY